MEGLQKKPKQSYGFADFYALKKSPQGLRHLVV
jgi:hypothetical protein